MIGTADVGILARPGRPDANSTSPGRPQMKGNQTRMRLPVGVRRWRGEWQGRARLIGGLPVRGLRRWDLGDPARKSNGLGSRISRLDGR